ncbi:hypothetical protein [Sagittula sp. S175]|uniref:hypothetical protein n=1 Tax=Sagittula sp. S175 TaxID=3415129 RepID=UPI003C7DC369
MTWFLAAQRAGLGALSLARTEGESRLCEVVLEDLIERLDFDLAVRGARAVPVLADRTLAGAGVDYIVLGSRLGTEVMRRMLSERLGRAALPTYFLAPSDGGLWQRHCAALNAVALHSVEAARIRADVLHGFEVFTRAAEAQPEVRGEAA